jgi:hypothetical protein
MAARLSALRASRSLPPGFFIFRDTRKFSIKENITEMGLILLFPYFQNESVILEFCHQKLVQLN